jgi:glycosyltransferase involved in cell wall biosynthesis
LAEKARTIDTGSIFYPRGGSAQVIRYLLPVVRREFGTRVRLLVGSLGGSGELSHAASFYRGIELFPADYTDAVAAAAWADPIAAPVPLHPSYEDRVGAPDRLFCAVSPTVAANLVRFWTAHLQGVGVAETDVMHLHHLTPLHAAVAAVRPGRPSVTTLHGTELKMLDNARRRVRLAARLGTTIAALADTLRRADDNSTVIGSLAAGHDLSEQDMTMLGDGRWQYWRYSDYWMSRLRAYAESTTRLVVISDQDRSEAVRLLGVDEASLAQVPNGVDTDQFTPLDLDAGQRLDRLRSWLVDEPRGWRPGSGPGSIIYTDADIARLRRHDGTLRPIFVFVGRFVNSKRLPLLVRCFAAAGAQAGCDPALVVWGGFPGEWEGVHPYDVALAEGIEKDVYFIGWRGHAELAVGLNCADVMVAPALGEPFGLVYLEAMACGRPVIASASGGPLQFVVDHGDRANGWLVPDQDEAGLVAAMVEAAGDPRKRRQRGAAATEMVRENYNWVSMARRYQDLYDEALTEQGTAQRETDARRWW